MRHLLVVSALVSLLGGCVVVPVGPPGGAYYGPRVVVPVPAVVVRPWYYRRGYGY
jgi:hypothetical protein